MTTSTTITARENVNKRRAMANVEQFTLNEMMRIASLDPSQKHAASQALSISLQSISSQSYRKAAGENIGTPQQIARALQEKGYGGILVDGAVKSLGGMLRGSGRPINGWLVSENLAEKDKITGLFVPTESAISSGYAFLKNSHGENGEIKTYRWDMIIVDEIIELGHAIVMEKTVKNVVVEKYSVGEILELPFGKCKIFDIKDDGKVLITTPKQSILSYTESELDQFKDSAAGNGKLFGLGYKFSMRGTNWVVTRAYDDLSVSVMSTSSNAYEVLSGYQIDIMIRKNQK